MARLQRCLGGSLPNVRLQCREVRKVIESNLWTFSVVLKNDVDVIMALVAGVTTVIAARDKYVDYSAARHEVSGGSPKHVSVGAQWRTESNWRAKMQSQLACLLCCAFSVVSGVCGCGCRLIRAPSASFWPGLLPPAAQSSVRDMEGGDSGPASFSGLAPRREAPGKSP